MGDKYILCVTCPTCGLIDNDVYYAPTCGFTDWECPECKTVVNLEKYSGISYEDASNEKEIRKAIFDAVNELAKPEEKQDEHSKSV